METPVSDPIVIASATRPPSDGQLGELAVVAGGAAALRKEMDRESQTPLVTLGERIGRTVRYTRAEISAFARMSFDDNPLHHDVQAARQAGFGEVIAAGQQTSSIMMGLVASHFARPAGEVMRELLCLNFNFAYKQPVFAEQDVDIGWKVTAIETNRKLGGVLVHLDGVARVPPDTVAVIGRGTVLLRTAAPASSVIGPPQSQFGTEALDVAE